MPVSTQGPRKHFGADFEGGGRCSRGGCLEASEIERSPEQFGVVGHAISLMID